MAKGTFLLAFFVLFCMCSSVIAIELEWEEDFCSATMRLIKEGKDTRHIVKTGIEVDTGVCNVVKCAYEGGGTLADIVIGAIDSGASPDSVASCLINAGAEPGLVALALQDSEIIRASEAAMITGHPFEPAIIAGPPGGEGVPGIAVSPSGF